MSLLVNTRVPWPDLRWSAPGLRSSCTWLWWLVGVVWMRPWPWSNQPSCSASRRSSFTYLQRTPWPHSLKKGWEDFSRLKPELISCKCSQKSHQWESLIKRSTDFLLSVRFFRRRSDLWWNFWFHAAHVKRFLSHCNTWHQDQSTFNFASATPPSAAT